MYNFLWIVIMCPYLYQCHTVPWDIQQAALYCYTIYKAKDVQLTDELTILTNS